MDALSDLVQREDLARSPSRCTKRTNQALNGQCTKRHIIPHVYHKVSVEPILRNIVRYLKKVSKHCMKVKMLK